MSDVLDALMPVTRLLEELGVPHYVGGSFASSAHGVARASLDVDVVADLAPEQVQAFVSGLQGAYYVDEARVRAAVEFRRSFNLIHLATMFKIDVFMTRGRAFDRESLGRARREAFSADPKAPRVLVASAEDTVLAKLEWFRKGGGVSERQWADVVGVLKLGGPNLDVGYLRRWAGALRVTDLLERALDEASGAD